MTGPFQELRFPVPRRGVYDALDPATPEFPANAAPELENLRVGRALAETRLGMAPWDPDSSGGGTTFGTAGAIFWLGNFYRSDGLVWRVAALGGALYSMRSNGTAFAPEENGLTFSATPQNGMYSVVQVKDFLYVADRQNTLKRFTAVTSGMLTTRYAERVTLPAGPAAAPGWRRRTLRFLRIWRGGSFGVLPYGLTEVDNAGGATSFNAELADPDDDATPDFEYSRTAGNILLLEVDDAGAKNDTVQRALTTNLDLDSKWLAFWYVQSSKRPYVTFEIGLTDQGDFKRGLNPQEANTPSLFVFDTTLSTIRRWRFRVQKQPPAATNLYVGPLVLPGKLQGEYRWVYTHYDSVNQIESPPSPVTYNGRYSDFTQRLVCDRSRSARALEKSCELLPVSDSGSVTTTNKYRFYRNGGIPENTYDARGQAKWTLLAEVPDLETTLAASASALDGGYETGSSNYERYRGAGIRLTAVTSHSGTRAVTLAAGDWLCLEPDTDDKEEFVQIGPAYSYTDLAVSGGNTSTVTSSLRPFLAGDAGNTLTITSGTNWTPGTYLINSVAGGVATLASAAATNSGATSGTGTLPAVNTGTGKLVMLRDNLRYAHSSGVTVRTALVDNYADEELNGVQVIDLERDDPPIGIHWICKSPEGRLVACRWADTPMGVAISNLPTIYAPYDHEVFPENVDPFTRQSLTQGWRFSLSGDASGDEIVWAGYYQDLLTLLTRKALYRVYARSQAEWGSNSVVKVLDVGCLAGQTVAEVDGVLHWVTEGPRVVRWGGSGPVQDLSFERISARLQSASPVYWSAWHAVAHRTQSGSYYRLWFAPSGATTCTQRLDYSVVLDAWEPVVYYDGAAAALPFKVTAIFDGPGDTNQMYSVHPTSGQAFLMETGSSDYGTPIAIRWKTPRMPLGVVGKLEQLYLRQPSLAFSDSVTATVTAGGAEYGDTTQAYSSLSLSSASDLEIKQRLHPDLRGRWAQVLLTSGVSNRPSLREVTLEYSVVRTLRAQS